MTAVLFWLKYLFSFVLPDFFPSEAGKTCTMTTLIRRSRTFPAASHNPDQTHSESGYSFPAALRDLTISSSYFQPNRKSVPGNLLLMIIICFNDACNTVCKPTHSRMKPHWFQRPGFVVPPAS